MDHEQDRSVRRLRRQIDIDALRGIGAIGDVLMHRDVLLQLRGDARAEQQQRHCTENEQESVQGNQSQLGRGHRPVEFSDRSNYTAGSEETCAPPMVYFELTAPRRSRSVQAAARQTLASCENYRRRPGALRTRPGT